MMKRNGLAIAKMAAVLIPVVVGSLLGLMASIATNYYSFRAERKEIIRKEHLAHLERAMILAARYSNDVGKALSVGLIRKGDVTLSETSVLSAPTDTLMELSVAISLYLPQLRSDVERIYAVHVTMMMHFDEIIDARGEHAGEDAAAFGQRIQREVTPAMEGIRSLMAKLSDLAQRDDA